ncbi:MAG: DUF308 domain-containing protein [Clostridia bacterium]|nr:DUF308 domain-containing protein [Clostridia bacterium]
MLEKLKSFKWGYILIGLTLIAVGVLFLAFSNALNYLAIAIGIVQLLFGVIYVALTIAKTGRGVSFYFNIVFAATAIISGATTLIVRENSIDIIASLIALLLIIDSGFKFHTAAMSKRYNKFGWWFILSLSALTAAGGYWMLKFPPAEILGISILLGIILIIDGVSNIFSAFYLTACEKSEEERIYLKAQSELSASDDSEESEPDEQSEADAEEGEADTEEGEADVEAPLTEEGESCDEAPLDTASENEGEPSKEQNEENSDK